MTDEEKAEEYADKILSDSKYPFIFSKEEVKAYIIKVYLDSLKCCKNAYNKGLAEGRKEQENKDKGFCESFCMKGVKNALLEKENKELNNQLYDLKESYNKIIDEVIETAKSYGLISETCLWQYINEYDNKKITYDELYEKLLSVAVQELKMAIEDMKKRL